MKCLICSQEIKYGEQIFFGTQMILCGPGENDCEYSGAPEGLSGGICLSCLESPVEVPRTPNTAICEPVGEESRVVVERSDALALFDL